MARTGSPTARNIHSRDIFTAGYYPRVPHPILGIIPTLDAPVIEVLAGTTRALTGRCQAFDIDRARLGEHLAAHDPLVENWLRDEVILAGEPLRSLIDNLAVVARS